jgi:periplasmic protein CpxP/Spy
MHIKLPKALPLLAIMAGGLLLLTPLGNQIVTAQPAATPSKQHSPLPFQKLNLSPEQKAKMQTIRQQALVQAQAVLSTDQRAQLKTALQNGEDMRSAMSRLNLTTEQKTKLREIMQSTQAQFDVILTPEQRQQLQQARRAWIQSLPPDQQQKLREKMRSALPGNRLSAN